MARITLLCGAARSERSAKIDALWHEYGDTAILLTPTARLARARQRALVREHRLPGLFGNRAWELTDFARAVLEATGRRARMLSILERKLITRRALETLPKRIACPQITPGLVRHLLQTITQLKQAAVEPEAFRAATSKSAHSGMFDNLVAAVYGRYQEMLVAEDRYDVPGLYWEAERCCRDGAFPLPNCADTILLDGFDDFTLSQQRFLAALSERVSRMVIGLHYDADPDRGDLFLLQQRWVEKFTAQMNIEPMALPTYAPHDYIQYVAQHLFWRNPPPPPTALRANTRIIPCADAQHEMESIGRQVKLLITREGVAPQRIAVCLTDMEQTALALRVIFEGFGIPLAMRVPTTLLATATGAFLMRLLDALDTYECNTVTSLLASPLTTHSSLPMGFPLLSRCAGVVMGRTEWEQAFARLETLFKDDNARERDAIVIPEPTETLALFQKQWRKLMALADAMPETDTLHNFARILDNRIGEFLAPLCEQIEAFGPCDAAAAHADPNAMQHEAAAMRAARSLLEQLAVATYTDAPVRRAEFARFLGEAMSETPVVIPGEDGLGVFCCGLDGLRHERFDYVFLGGLNEGALPRPAHVNAVYSESDLNRLRRLGLDLPGRYEHTHRERLLFIHAVSAAQQELTLSWRKQDSSGRDALPSPFVVDIADMFGAHEVNIVLPEPGPDCFVPEPSLMASKRDLANIAYYRDYRQLQTDFPDLTAPINRVVAIETRRNSAACFDRYDGCLAAPDLREAIAALYGDAAQFSVNQIETYIKFPFQFFMERVLAIRETKPPEAEMDALTRGLIAHDALYRFHKRFAGASVADLLAQDESGARNAMRDCIHAAFRSNKRNLLAVPEATARVEQCRLEAALDRYLERAAKDFGADLTPRYFEAVFGRAPRDAEEDLHTQEPFLLTVGGETFRLTGKIDRIDADEKTARIIDYKSSATPEKKDIMNALDLQLTVYAWALEKRLLTDRVCREAFYYSVYKNKKREALWRNKEEEYAAREQNARARIAAAIHGIRAGQFPPLPDASLNQIDAHPAARYEEWRIKHKAAPS